MAYGGTAASSIHRASGWLVAGSIAIASSTACGARTGMGDLLESLSGSAGTHSAGSGGSAGTAGSAAGHGGLPGAAGAAGMSGTAGMAGAAGTPACPLLIDNMESGTGWIPPCVDRAGAWYAYNDGFGVQEPAPTNVAGVPILPIAIPGGRGASKRAMFSRFITANNPQYNPSVNWGAGIGVDLDFDGQRYRSFDASEFEGIHFWVRGSGSYVQVRVSTIATTLVDYGGTCPAEFCAPLQYPVGFTNDWSEVWVRFRDLQNSDWSHPQPWGDDFRKDQLTNIQFLYVQRDDSVDFWLDDLSFYRSGGDPLR